MTCLTVTPASAAEAIREQAGLIVSHHPVLFREVKKIRADMPETGYLWKLARAGIAIASPHTAFDNTHDGINDILCRRLGLVEVAPLRPLSTNPSGPSNAVRSFKVVVFTPEAEREAVSSAAFTAGAGRIGAYEECSFAIPGEGTFFGTEEANPTVGERGRRMTVRELRLEFVCPARQLAECRSRRSVPIIPTKSPRSTSIPCMKARETALNRAGAGRIGSYGEARGLEEFAMLVGRVLGRVPVAMVGDPNAAGPARGRRLRCRRRFPQGRRPRRGRRALDRRGAVPPRSRGRGPGDRLCSRPDTTPPRGRASKSSPKRSRWLSPA